VYDSPWPKGNNGVTDLASYHLKQRHQLSINENNILYTPVTDEELLMINGLRRMTNSRIFFFCESH
jgi:hypothetical protein